MPLHAPASLASRWWNACAQPALALLYPAACVGCGEEFAGAPPSFMVCDACLGAAATGYANPCPRCAMPLAGDAGQAMACSECHYRKHRFESAIAVGKYEGLLRRLVLRSKTAGDEGLALAFGKLLGERLAARPSSHDAIIPIPVPPIRRLFRAVNVAEIMAEAVADQLRLPRVSGALRFRRPVQKQSNLTPARRRRNVRNAMEGTGQFDLRGARLLVIDDVLTTGATADEAARALLAAGAAAVSVAVIARGVGFD